MTYTITLDFETHDPHLKMMGPGWAYGLCEILCMGYKIDAQEVKCTSSTEEIISLVQNAHTIVAHNAQYDIGILHSLLADTDKNWFKDKLLVDTVILAKLHDNTEESYGLNNLAYKYLNAAKMNSSLGDIVLKHKLINAKDHTTKLSKTKAENYSKKNMKQLYLLEKDIVEEYCKVDVELCYKLYRNYINVTDCLLKNRFSDLLKLMIKTRYAGVRVNSEKLFDIKQSLYKKRDLILFKLKEISGNEEFNPLSTADVAQILLKTMAKLPQTEKGNISITSVWLSEQEDPTCKLIQEYRMLEKLARDFCDNILEMQSILPERYKGKIYPTFNILGADTGRFSCTGPNLQQIPNAKKHKEIGSLIRGAYEPSPGKLWASIDYSAQEPRLQVHYASLIEAEGADLLVLEYQNDPNLDLHTTVAEITGVSRNAAKTINLGLAYGMGITKLAASLDLSMTSAKLLLNTFHSKLPYLKELDAAAKKSLKDKGHIQTIGNRKLKLDKPMFDRELQKERTFEYKALNKLIQGSASDQIMLALIALDKAGFTVISSIHDEVNLEINNISEAIQARKIMEDVIRLKVPVVATLAIGTTWGNGTEDTSVNSNTK